MIKVFNIAESSVAGTTELSSRIKSYRVKVNFDRLETIITLIFIFCMLEIGGFIEHLIG